MRAEVRRTREGYCRGEAGIRRALRCGYGLATVLATVGCMMAAALAAPPDLRASDVSGRWSPATSNAKQPCNEVSCQVAYDIVRCGEGWCGVEVKDGKECGRVAIRLDAGAVHPPGVEFAGRYEKAQGSEPYTIKANLRSGDQRGGQVTLSMLGNTGGDFQPWRRTFPLHMVLVRNGEATCRADPKMS